MGPAIGTSTSRPILRAAKHQIYQGYVRAEWESIPIVHSDAHPSR